MTITALWEVYTAALRRIPSLTVAFPEHLNGKAWNANPDTNEIELSGGLTLNEAGEAFVQAVTALDHAAGNEVRPLLRCLPGQRTNARPADPSPRLGPFGRVAWQA